MFFLFEDESCDLESRSIIFTLVFSSQSLLISFLNQNAQFSAFFLSSFCFLLSALQSFRISQSSSSLLLQKVLNGFTLLSKCFQGLFSHYLNIVCSLVYSSYIAILAVFPSSSTTFTKSPFGVICFLSGLLCSFLMPISDQKSLIRASSTWMPLQILVSTSSMLLFSQKCQKNYRTYKQFRVCSFEFEFINDQSSTIKSLGNKRHKPKGQMKNCRKELSLRSFLQVIKLKNRRF